MSKRDTRLARRNTLPQLRTNMQRLLVLAVFAVLLLVSSSIGSAPAYAENDTVRIGFFASDKYGYVGAEGDLRGYDIQLSKAIGMYGGFDTDMQGFDNITEMEDALRSGKVDALIDFLRTEKREQEFIFTNSPILEEQVSLYTNNTPDALSADSISEVKDLRIGYVTDSGFLGYFEEYCASLGISPELTSFHDEAAMHAAMDRGDTNASLTGSAAPTGYRVLMSLPPLSSYMMLRAEDEPLRNRVDSALDQIRTDEPDYLSNLYQQYIASHAEEMSPLASQEREYLAQHPDLTVAIVRGAEPFATEENGTFSGIVPDYYKALGEKLGVNFRFVAYDKTQDATDAVSKGDADILGQFYGDILIAERDGLYDTMEYGVTDCARLTKKSFSGPVKTVAVTNRTAYLVAEQLGSDVRLEAYPNIEACYQALMDNEVDAMIGSMTGITWLVNQHTMREVNLSILPNVSLGIRGAVSRDNSTLLFILNKAIAVSSDALNTAIIANAVDGTVDIRTALENLPPGVTIAVGSILTGLVIALVIALILLVRSSRERVSLLNREMNVDSLTGAKSRRYATELLNRELRLFRRYGDGPMLAMLDVDHFKEKNDSLGHDYGDFVLKKVVEVLRETLRKSDEIIRWGGDEFILMFPHLHDDDADLILKKVTSAINSADFQMDGKGMKVTISVGASFFLPGDEDITPVLRRCDTALYEAKSVRNTYRIFSDDQSESKEVSS